MALWGVMGCSAADPPAGATEQPDSGVPPDVAASDPQTPPQGQAALEAWLAEGHYLGWRCETAISAPRLNGAHGRHRICSNKALSTTERPPFPVGAASVKELFDHRDRTNGYAVGVKIAPGGGDSTWYWYERTGTSPLSRPVADGVAVGVCGPSCHAGAPRDNVFIVAP